MNTIAESISRVRNITKTVKEDAFVTDRFLYSLIIKHARTLIMKISSRNEILMFSDMFTSIPCMDLIESDKIEACCGGITSDCSIMKTKRKIPNIMHASYGPLFRLISSIDVSEEVFPTTPSTYTSMTKTSSYKYNKRKYYWYLNEHLYFPNLDWEAVRVEGIFEGNLATYICTEDPCTIRQSQNMLIPDHLFSEIEQNVLNDLGMAVKMPPDGPDDKMSSFR
jgi:hypothetical protein